MLRILLVGACVGAARLREADDNRESALTRGRGGGGSLRKLVHSPTARARQNVRNDATSRPSEKKPSDHVTCPAAAESQYVRRLGDGVCDVALNTEGCGWDLGDCCASTCREPRCGEKFPFCADPREATFAARCGARDAAKRVGDGRCDADLDTRECRYDGGDCCGWSCTVKKCDGANLLNLKKLCTRMTPGGQRLEAANDVPACSCECMDRFKYGADEERYLSVLLWPPVARTPALVDLARSRIIEVANVVQWARFDPGANFSAFLYEVYSHDKNDYEGVIDNPYIDGKRDWFAAHAEQTGTECVFALIKLMPSFWSARSKVRGHGHAAHEERLKKPIGLATAPRHLKGSIRGAIRRSGLIPDYNFHGGRDMNRNTAWRRKVAVHSTDSVYQMRATRLVAQRYLQM